MKYDARDTVLRDGLEVIRKYDPELYARMDAADWSVSTEFDAAFSEILDSRNPLDYLVTLSSAMRSLAITLPDTQAGVATPRTYVNMVKVAESAAFHGVREGALTAMTLAHEFQHIHNDSTDSNVSEPPAFRAGSAFAAKLPAPDGPVVKRISDDALTGWQAAGFRGYVS